MSFSAPHASALAVKVGIALEGGMTDEDIRSDHRAALLADVAAIAGQSNVSP